MSIIKSRKTLNENKDEKRDLNGLKNFWFIENMTAPIYLFIRQDQAERKENYISRRVHRVRSVMGEG
jgi:hypothetical protein